MESHKVVSREEGLAARRQLLAEEKEFTRCARPRHAERRLSLVDLMPKGRDETGPQKMAWVRLHDEYQR